MTKIALKKILGRALISFEEIQTILADIEAIINSRPLIYDYNEPNEPFPLILSNFLTGRRVTALPNCKRNIELIKGAPSFWYHMRDKSRKETSSSKKLANDPDTISVYDSDVKGPSKYTGPIQVLFHIPQHTFTDQRTWWRFGRTRCGFSRDQTDNEKLRFRVWGQKGRGQMQGHAGRSFPLAHYIILPCVVQWLKFHFVVEILNELQLNQSYVWLENLVKSSFFGSFCRAPERPMDEPRPNTKATDFNAGVPLQAEIVRVQYFVRGGSVGHRSRASSKHLSPHLPVDELDSSGDQTGVALHLQMHVWVSGPQRKPTRC
ncbi:uncharacterized protein TNCV_1750231 [Trichonephila clavipes]|nr:uncharacterized protein TNCV_1750231 [Trichonephila clavipes]